MEKSQLKQGYYIFGNKGNVWNNECHISEADASKGTTLCGVPMLSNNWARIQEIQNIGCTKCLKIYLEKLN